MVDDRFTLIDSLGKNAGSRAQEVRGLAEKLFRTSSLKGSGCVHCGSVDVVNRIATGTLKVDAQVSSLTGESLMSLLLIVLIAQTLLTPAQAKAHIGEVATVCGKVMSARFAESSNRQPTFLNLDEPFPNTSSQW
jgi:hypothetical protein